jgi:hypothetical protein
VANVSIKDKRHFTVPILRWLVGDVGKVTRDQLPRLQCRPDRLEIEWRTQNDQKAVITILAGHLATIEVSMPLRRCSRAC